MSLREIVILLVGFAAGWLLPRLLRDRADRLATPPLASASTEHHNEPDATRAELLPEEVRALADDDELIAAIKRMRELTGVGLKEAKDAVDAYRASRRI